MAQTAEPKVSLLQKWREKRKRKRDRSGEKSEPASRRPKAEADYDEDRLHRIGRGGYFG